MAFLPEINNTEKGLHHIPNLADLVYQHHGMATAFYQHLGNITIDTLARWI